jgi:hypothetical protein
MGNPKVLETYFIFLFSLWISRKRKLHPKTDE